MLSSTVPSISAGSCGTRQTSRRSSSGSRSRTSLAPVATVPASGSASRFSSRSSVDLPDPDGPATQLAPSGSAARQILEHDLAVPLHGHPLELEEHGVIITR